MSRGYELSTLRGMPKQHWLIRAEQDRFRDIVLNWKRKNKDATIYHEMLFEELLRVHLLIQRLSNRAVFFDGSSSDYRNISENRTVDVGEQDSKRLAKEWKEHYPTLCKLKIELLKLAMANKIEFAATGDIAQLFSALDTQNQVRQNEDSSQDIYARSGDR